jgi:DNA mismatch repair protein MutS
MPQWQKLSDQINPCEFLFNKISTELKEDVPMVSNMGNLIRDGVDQELDDLRKIAFSGKDFLVQIQQREIENTGISSLKIAYNKVFGYYLEVTNSHKDKVPSGWIRKQTLVNAERYITEELKQYEEKILGAEDQIHIIEQRLFNDLVESAADFVGLIQQNARAIAAIDCLVSFASMAAKNEYVKPKVTDGKTLHIQAGRHPGD